MADERTPSPGRVLARLARQLEVALTELGLTIAQYRVLGILGDGREAASVLADKLAVSRPSVTGVVDGLVARGFVRRDHAGHDRRRIDIALTPAGRLVLAAADIEVERRLPSLVGAIPDTAIPSPMVTDAAIAGGAITDGAVPGGAIAGGTVTDGAVA